MSWASRRKTTYGLSVLFFCIIIFIAIAFSFFYKKPTCFDGAMNGNETGIDCGGSCEKLCRADFSNPIVSWVRTARITNPGNYNFLAYVINPNIGVGAKNAVYDLKIYDKQNVLIFEKTGSTYIPAVSNFTVFEEGININDKIPEHVVFTFQNGIAWEKIPSPELSLQTVTKDLENPDTKPKLSVTLKNTSVLPIKNIESVAILYDENGNAIAFSRTVSDVIDKDSTADIVYTWPEPFDSKIFKIDIFSKVLPN